MSNFNQNDIDTLDTRFSMRMFIADLPRVLNEAFALIKKIINKIYDCTKDEIKVSSINTTTVKASTIITNSISLRDSSSGRTINYGEIDDMKNDIERIKEELGITR